MTEFNKRNRGVIHSIVSKFSEVINYKANIENADSVNNFLMITGGTVTERDACIDYLTEPPFGKLVGLPGLDTNSKEQKKISINFKSKPYQVESFTENIKNIPNLNKSGNNPKLILLKDVSYSSQSILSSFADLFESLITDQFFIIATTESKEDLKDLPSKLMERFETIHITYQNQKTERKHFPSKEEIDSILQNFINQYPNKSREFIARRAIPSIQNEFPQNKLYGKNTLISRISNIRKNTTSKEMQKC